MGPAATAENILIVGAGQAGGQLASELRQLGHAGPVTIVGDEPWLPYKRPPLSKGFLAGSVTQDSLYVMPKAALEKANVGFIGDARVVRIHRATKQIEISDGRKLAYDRLALCTGSRARPLPGAEGSNVFPLRTIADVENIRAQCVQGKRAVIVGGGFIGLEVAAVLVKLGLKVTVLEGLARVLARVTAPEVSAFFERMHREAGVDLRTDVQIESFDGKPCITHLTLGDGTRIETDFVVIGIGILPNVELAQDAGLEVDNGIVVDEFTRTSDENIVAAGDCSNHPNAHFGRRLRLESVQNAMEQGRCAARNLMGRSEPYQMVPWFWSDQYDLKLQMVGLSNGFDQIVLRGDPKTQRNFAAFYLKQGQVIAADAVTRPLEFMLAKKIVAMKLKLDPAQLADETVPLKTLVPA